MGNEKIKLTECQRARKRRKNRTTGNSVIWVNEIGMTELRTLFHNASKFGCAKKILIAYMQLGHIAMMIDL
jgi:hypothetical protein